MLHWQLTSKRVLPDYDEERVYPSDIKKILNWYNMMQAKGLVVDEVVAEADLKPLLKQKRKSLLKKKKQKKM
jgi:hypothetical protein